MMRKIGWIAASLVVVLAGCGSDPVVNPPADAGNDTGSVQDVVTTDRPDSGNRTDVVTADAGRTTASSPCMDETTCENIETPQCLPFNGAGFCTGTCMPGTSTQERTACGVGGTCVSGVPLQAQGGGTIPGICMQSCTPSASSMAAGACREGQVCTGFWYNNEGATPDNPGCWLFCTQDSQCMGSQGGNFCNVRTGQCAMAASNPALLADGSPCNGMGTTAQCRGTCFRTSSTRPTQGICGSFVNLARSQQCPDNAMQAPLARAGMDNTAICLWRPCTTNSDCSMGHICRLPEDAMGAPVEAPATCDYPTTAQPTGITGDGGVRADGAVTDAPAPTDVPAATDVPATDAGAPADVQATDAVADAGGSVG